MKYIFDRVIIKQEISYCVKPIFKSLRLFTPKLLGMEQQNKNKFVRAKPVIPSPATEVVLQTAPFGKQNKLEELMHDIDEDINNNEKEKGNRKTMQSLLMFSRFCIQHFDEKC